MHPEKGPTIPETPTEDGAREILRISGATTALMDHVTAVRGVALRLCDRISVPVDRDLVAVGALLHDLGRVRSNGLQHVIEGVALARTLGLSEAVCRIIQRHVGAGLSSEEAEEAGLPPGDYLPETTEEKVVAYADNLVYGDRVISFEESLDRFNRLLGPGSPVVRRMAELHQEILSWCSGVLSGL